MKKVVGWSSSTADRALSMQLTQICSLASHKVPWACQEWFLCAKPRVRPEHCQVCPKTKTKTNKRDYILKKSTTVSFQGKMSELEQKFWVTKIEFSNHGPIPVILLSCAPNYITTWLLYLMPWPPSPPFAWFFFHLWLSWNILEYPLEYPGSYIVSDWGTLDFRVPFSMDSM